MKFSFVSTPHVLLFTTVLKSRIHWMAENASNIPSSSSDSDSLHPNMFPNT